MRYDAPDPTALSPLHRLAWGARYAARGVHLVVTHPSVWWMVLVPVLVTLGLFVGGVWALGFLLPWLTGFLWSPGPHTSVGVWLVYELVLWLFRISVAIALAVVLYLTAGLVATPFNDALSQRVEREVLGTRPGSTPLPQVLADLWWSFVHSALSLVVYLAVLLLAFLLNLVPGIGSVAAFVVGAVASGFFFAREAMDGAMSRRRTGYVQKWRLVLRHWAICLGFGLCVSVLMWIPLLNFLVLPMSVAGGTLLFCHLEQGGHLD